MADIGTVPVESLVDSFDDSSESTLGCWAQLVPIASNTKSFSTIDIVGLSHSFGRAATCDTKFEELGISGKHCRIFKEPIPAGKASIVKIEDTSTNGTAINGNQIKKASLLLSDGDTITFLKSPDAKIEFVFKMISKSDDLDGPYKTYQVGQLLGTGQFANVHLCIHKSSGQAWAIKIIDKKKFALSSTTDRADALIGEVDILRKIDHPGCIKINETFETNEKLYLILELVSGGDLFDHITAHTRFDESQSRDYFSQLLSAIKYLHDHGIVHRDLKPENILLKSKTEHILKVSDFGLSRVLNEGSNMKTMCGTPQYVAPEVLTQGGPTNTGYTRAVDLWSLGVILFILLAGYQPFEDKPEGHGLYQKIKTADFIFLPKYWKAISPEAKDLIIQLLIVDPTQRISVDAALEHPWIKNTKFDAERAAAVEEAIADKIAGKRKTMYPITVKGETASSSSQPKPRSKSPAPAAPEAKATSSSKPITNGIPEATEEANGSDQMEVDAPPAKKTAKAKATKATSAAKKAAPAKKTAKKAATPEEPQANGKKRKAESMPEDIESPPKRKR